MKNSFLRYQFSSGEYRLLFQNAEPENIATEPEGPEVDEGGEEAIEGDDDVADNAEERQDEVQDDLDNLDFRPDPDGEQVVNEEDVPDLFDAGDEADGKAKVQVEADRNAK